MPCFFTQLFAPSLSILLLTYLPTYLGVQGAPASNQPPAKSAGNDTALPTLTLDVANVELRTVLKLVFDYARAEYSVDTDVPDVKVNLRVKDQSLETVLGIILQQGKSQGKRLTYAKEGSIYRIRVVPESVEPSVLRSIPIQNVQAETLISQIQTLVPDALFLTNKTTNSLLIRGTEDTIMQAVNIIRVLDVVPKAFILKAEVVMVLADKGKGKNTLLSTILRSQAGQEAEGEDKISSSPSQSSRLLLNAKAMPMGDGTYEVTTRWNVVLPLHASQVEANSKKESLIQLEKRVTNTTRVKPGQTNVIGGVILSQYNLKGEILFFLTLTEADESK